MKSFGYYETNQALKQVIDQISSGVFSGGDRQLFRPLINSLLYQDEFLLMADYQLYVDCQQKVSKAYLDKEKWTTMSIETAAHMGNFSSDCSIMEYAKKIWKINVF